MHDIGMETCVTDPITERKLHGPDDHNINPNTDINNETQNSSDSTGRPNPKNTGHKHHPSSSLNNNMATTWRLCMSTWRLCCLCRSVLLQTQIISVRITFVWSFRSLKTIRYGY